MSQQNLIFKSHKFDHNDNHNELAQSDDFALAQDGVLVENRDSNSANN